MSSGMVVFRVPTASSFRLSLTRFPFANPSLVGSYFSYISFFAGDALSSPTHWYYGGKRQIVADYGHEIIDYTKPNRRLAGSILNKSNIYGGGRSGYGSKSISIIGDVINHGKKDLWSPTQSIHYHATLEKGENTLEAQLARVLMKSIVQSGGKFDANHFRNMYVQFMTTPGSHNDTYASTCHRMFFANMIYNQLPPEQCPDNDHHNVDTVDGLVLPTLVAMSQVGNHSSENVAIVASKCASVTRESSVLERTAGLWAQVVASSIQESDDTNFANTLSSFSQHFLARRPNPNVNDASTMSACYLQQSLPGLVDMTSKYVSTDNGVWQGLLANANTGGENVHRGSVLGAILGARAGESKLPAKLIQGLYAHSEIAKEIDDFVQAVLPRKETCDINKM